MRSENKHALSALEQNQERKHRTYVYVLIVTEVLEDWEDSVNIGKRHLFTCQIGDHTDKVLRQSHGVCSFRSRVILLYRFYCRFVRGNIISPALFLPL